MVGTSQERGEGHEGVCIQEAMRCWNGSHEEPLAVFLYVMVQAYGLTLYCKHMDIHGASDIVSAVGGKEDLLATGGCPEGTSALGIAYTTGKHVE